MPFPNLVQVVLPMDSGLPEDVAVNTWHISLTAEENLAAMTLAITALATYYQSMNPYWSRQMANDVEVKAYNLLDPTPRVPWTEQSFVLDTPTSSSALPSEVACVMSFRGAYVSGGVNARSRNRVFLGPLQLTALGSASPRLARPSEAFTDTVHDAGAALMSASAAAAGWEWIVWSQRQRDLLPLEYVGQSVIAGWVDDAFDTQRRRGVAPTGRETF